MTTPQVRPLQANDLDELCRFLTAGFRTPADVDFALPDVLAWKYLGDGDDPDDQRPRSFVACDPQGAIIGHVGVCRSAFQGPQLNGGSVTTLHMIDWLGSPGHASIGASLMRRAHEGSATQFGLGGSQAGRAVIRRGGYEPRDPVAVYQRVLNPVHWMRVPELPFSQQVSRLARDASRASWLARRSWCPRLTLGLQRVARFAEEVDVILRGAVESAIVTRRTAARLNRLLRFPRQEMSGWHLVDPANRLVGFALLNLIPHHRGQVRLGKIVDCLLSNHDANLWSAAIQGLTRELARQGADVIQTFASTPWLARGLRENGYSSRFDLEFSLRDRRQLLPADGMFHLMPIEADYAYT